MAFIDWDPLARAAIFGGIFLVSLFAVLWVWYDTSLRPGANGWYWRIGATLLIVLTVPAVVLGAANLDADRETWLNVAAWLSIGAGAAALLAVLSYGVWGRAEVYQPAPMPMPEPSPTEFDPATPPAPAPPAPPRPQKPADAYLFVKDGPDKGRQFPVDGTTIIGRSSPSTVVLDDHRVSGQHAQVKRSGTGFVFTDLNSSNGSFLVVEDREAEIRGSQELVDGDRVRLGRTILEFIDARKGRAQ